MAGRGIQINCAEQSRGDSLAPLRSEDAEQTRQRLHVAASICQSFISSSDSPLPGLVSAIEGSSRE